ncbi:MAG: DUF2177 family protein [Candidatus Nanoarchaeia archaeon]|nr:DUF2177 family protein [Candidatus Nanoarchaeia archaeon]
MVAKKINFLKYFLIWIVSFIFISTVDAVWHLVIFRNPYVEGIKPVARMAGNEFAFKLIPGLLSQIIVVTSIFLLVACFAGKDIKKAALIGAIAGILTITVYGLVNYSLIEGWGIRITILEVIWGPILGSISAVFVMKMLSSNNLI